jgi:GST-like protein
LIFDIANFDSFTSTIGKPISLFESASIVQYFAEKHGRFIPSDPVKRQECFNWIYWQMGGFGPFCGQFGHFMVYAPADKVEARNYGVSRYGKHGAVHIYAQVAG